MYCFDGRLKLTLRGGIEMYFLRMYAAELRKPRRDRIPWGPFWEAVFQTALIVYVPIIGIGAAAIVLLPASLNGPLSVHRGLIEACSAVASGAAAYLLVWRLVRGYKKSPQSAAMYGTSRDRLIGNLQFWSVAVVSLMLPFIAAVLVKVTGQ